MVGPEITRRLPYYKELKVSFYDALGAAVVLGCSFTHNYIVRRPFGASIPKHVAAGIVGLYVGRELDKYVESRRNQKVLIIEDYICKHPEDFPLVKPKKYKDILLVWNPLR